MESDNKRGIAIDGPAGSGKSTVVKCIAKILGINYVDSGAFYRTISYWFSENNITEQNFKDMSDVELTNELNKIVIEPYYNDQKQFIVLNGRELDDEVLRTETISRFSTVVAQNKLVRAKVTSICQDVAKKFEVVMEGRDITTCVMPDAKLKIFLEADVEIRASRRVEQLKQKGHVDVKYEDVLRDMIARDKSDFENENSTFSQAKRLPDCITLDTSDLSIDEVADRIVELYK